MIPPRLRHDPSTADRRTTDAGRGALVLNVLLVVSLVAGCGGQPIGGSGTSSGPSTASSPTLDAPVPTGRAMPPRRQAATPSAALGAADPVPAPSASPTADRVPPPSASRTPDALPSLGAIPSPLPPSPARDARRGDAARPFSMNLYRKGDFVAQYTLEWCVGASIQMTLNMLRPSDDRTRSLQQRVWEMARDRSFSPFGGANPRGWVAVLNKLGVGPYELVSIPTYRAALRVAARALRETGRPVGLVMWRGRHAWVMSGFTSMGDPRVRRDFQVTGVHVLDPLYPRSNSRWGPSPAPGSLLKPSVLDDQFVFRKRRRVNLGVPPGYLLVLPRPAAAE